MLTSLRVAGWAGCIVILAGLMARGQAPPAATSPQPTPGADADAGGGIDAVDAEFQRGVDALERKRLERLAELAAGQQGQEAAATYEAYFRRAVDAGMFTEAEPLAERVIQSRMAEPVVAWLAHVVNILAEADRGAYKESLDSLIAVVQARPKEAPGDAAVASVLPLEAAFEAPGGVLPAPGSCRSV